MSTYLYFNTKDRDEGDDTGQCAFFTNSILGNRSAYLSLVNVTIPVLFYPISRDRGNFALYFQEDGSTSTTYSLELITDNNPTGVSLAADLQAKMNAESGKTYTVTYDLDTGKISIAVNSGTFRIIDGPNSAHIEIGYNVDDSTFHSGSFELHYPVDISGTKYIDVVTNLGNQASWNSSGTYTVATRVPCVASFGEILIENLPLSQKIRSFSPINRISFSLRDDRGKLIYLGKNHSCSFTYVLEPVEVDRESFRSK